MDGWPHQARHPGGRYTREPSDEGGSAVPDPIPASSTSAPRSADAPGAVAACLRVVARASAAAGDADGVRSALTNALHDALAVDPVLIFEVAQGAAAGDAHVMRNEGGEDKGYVQALDGRPSGTARVVRTGVPLHVADARGSSELRGDLVDRFSAASVLFAPVSWAGEVRHVAISVFRERWSA